MLDIQYFRLFERLWGSGDVVSRINLNNAVKTQNILQVIYTQQFISVALLTHWVRLFANGD